MDKNNNLYLQKDMRVEYAYRFRLYPEISKKKFENKLLLRLKKEYPFLKQITLSTRNWRCVLSNTLHNRGKHISKNLYKIGVAYLMNIRLRTVQADACRTGNINELLRKQICDRKVAVSTGEHSTIHLAVNQEIFLKLAGFQSKQIPQFVGE